MTIEAIVSLFDRLEVTDDPRADVAAVIDEYRAFVRDNAVLAELMFSRPFADFDPDPSGAAAGTAVRHFIVGRVRRCLEQGLIEGDVTDIAHVLLSAAQGLAATERAGWLGRSKAPMDRRWALALRALLDGLAPRR